MERPAWKGAISFGLVSVPVTLHRAVGSEEGISFDLLDQRDHSRIGYKKVSKRTGREVPKEEIKKGLKLPDGSYVLVDEDELKRASPERTQRIDIDRFVLAKEIDLLFYDRPYYVAPTPKYEKGYALLRETLEKTERVGIATIVLHTKQYVAALYPEGRAMVLHLLRYAQDVLEPTELDLPPKDLKASHVSTAEVNMAVQLVEGMTGPWKPEDFRDTYRDEVLAFLKKKAKSGDVVAAEEPEEGREKPAPALDMMRLLKQSVEQQGKPKPARRSRTA
jgi:DNA end-binding protein Ku